MCLRTNPWNSLFSEQPPVPLRGGLNNPSMDLRFIVLMGALRGKQDHLLPSALYGEKEWKKRKLTVNLSIKQSGREGAWEGSVYTEG